MKGILEIVVKDLRITQQREKLYAAAIQYIRNRSKKFGRIYKKVKGNEASQFDIQGLLTSFGDCKAQVLFASAKPILGMGWGAAIHKVVWAQLYEIVAGRDIASMIDLNRDKLNLQPSFGFYEACHDLCSRSSITVRKRKVDGRRCIYIEGFGVDFDDVYEMVVLIEECEKYDNIHP